MIVAFYGITGGGAATTCNLLCTALMSCFQYQYSVLMVSLSSGAAGLEMALQERDGRYKIAEEAEYFYSYGMDQVLKEAACGTLQPPAIIKAAREAAPGAWYLETAQGSCCERVWTELEKYGGQILDAMSVSADLVFLDCGTGKGDFMREVERRAGVIVINLIQNRRALSQFFCRKQFYPQKTVYLTGRYEEFFPCKRSHILKEGRMMPEDLSEIPYNAGFQDAIENGKCARFLHRNVFGASYEKNQFFIRQVKGATDMILRKGEFLG